MLQMLFDLKIRKFNLLPIKQCIFAYMINRYIFNKTLFTGIVLFLSLSFSFGQDDDFMKSGKDGAEVYELPKGKFSQKVQTLYTDLLSRLYNDRTALNQEISELNSKKKEMLQSGGNRDITELNKISKTVQEKAKELVDIDNDIELLRSGFNEKSNEKRAVRIINSVNSKRYGSVAMEDKPEKWNGNTVRKANTEIRRESDCKVVENGIDPVSLKSKILIGSETIIEYTHPKLESFYKDESFITAEAGMMLLDKTYYLVLDIVIKSRDAVKNYGVIEAGAPMKVELLNGESAYLFSASNVAGSFIPDSNKVSYQAVFTVNKSEYKLLKKSEVDNIGIMWSSGYEKYDVYNVDLVMNQLACLENFK